MTSLTFRPFQDERDYPLLLDLNLSNRRADKDNQSVTLEMIANALAHMDGLAPQQGVIIALLDGIPAGYSRLGFYSSSADTSLYYQISFLGEAYRDRGIWQAIIQDNESRLSEIANGQAFVPQRFFQAWTTDKQLTWGSVLEGAGYKVVRRFNNMMHYLDEIPECPFPSGMEVHPIKPEDMRRVWEAQKEMNDGLFENVAEDWLEEKHPEWLEKPEHDPRFWQVAWDSDQLAGMVLARIDEKENAERNRRHGYTEHIYVRPQWRKRGLASALIARSLQVLKGQGMTEAELGVDSENESAAYRLYQSLGYKTFSVDTWYRKALEK